MTTLVPPAVGPDVGATLVTVGAAHVGELVGRACWRSVPPVVGDPHVDRAGRVRGRGRGDLVALLTVNVVAAVPPKLTAVAPVNPVPVITTLVPPAVGPDDGVEAGDGRRADVGELVTAAGGAGAARGGDRDVDRARGVRAARWR